SARRSVRVRWRMHRSKSGRHSESACYFSSTRGSYGMTGRRHRVLVVGVGSIGERHLRCFLSTGRADVNFVEGQPALRQTIADRYGIAKPWESLDQALESPPEVAVICTPAPLHISQATLLAEGGAQLLIEKPLSTTLAGIDELKQVVARRKTVAA